MEIVIVKGSFVVGSAIAVEFTLAVPETNSIPGGKLAMAEKERAATVLFCTVAVNANWSPIVTVVGETDKVVTTLPVRSD